MNQEYALRTHIYFSHLLCVLRTDKNVIVEDDSSTNILHKFA